MATGDHKMHETPDIEIQGDEFEDQQAILKQIDDDEALEVDFKQMLSAAALVSDEAEFKFKRRDRVVDIVTGHAGRVISAVKGLDDNNYGVVLDDDAGYVVRLEQNLKSEADFNSCDALRIIDGVKDDPDEE